MAGVVYPSIFVIIVLLQEMTHCQQSEGESCTHKSTGFEGVCRLLHSCQQAIEELKLQRYPQICGFQGTKPIICCPLKENGKLQRKPGDVSYEKCREYSKYKRQIEQSPTLITGGQIVIENEFPHMALVGFEKSEGGIEWLCGGSTISERYILTAAHCLNYKTYGPAKYVRIGITNPTKAQTDGQEIRVAERIAHPDYKPWSLYNDIALLKLERPAIMNAYTTPACLYSHQEINAKKAVATGWGKTQYGGSNSDDLLKVTLDLVDQQSCNHSYKNQISRRFHQGIVEESQLCSGSIDGDGKDTCQGDSGGPLQIDHSNDDIRGMYDIIGVTSFGKACGLSVGVYTRVSFFIKWIEDTVWPDNS